MTDTTDNGFESWAILELTDHRRLSGFVRGVQIAGAGYLRIDVPLGQMDCAGCCDPHGPRTCRRLGHQRVDLTQFYRASSVYCLTPVSEAAVRAEIGRALPPEERIANYLQRIGSASATDVAGDLGLNRATVSHIFNSNERFEMAKREGKVVFFRLADSGPGDEDDDG